MSNIKSVIFAICLALLPVGNTYFQPHAEHIMVLDCEYYYSSVTTFFFEYTSTDSLNYKQIYFNRVTPGLPSFVNHTDQVKPYIKLMVTNAEIDIPVKKRPNSPLMFVGSTSFRKLSTWNAMLDVIKNFFDMSDLRIDTDSISLMEGRKVMYIWLTVNLLLGRLHKAKSQTAAVLELGGVTSRVAYVPQLDEWYTKWQWKSIVNVSAFGRIYELYRYNYYRLGLNEARVQILDIDRIRPGYKYVSECIYPQLNTTWTYRDQVYHILGAKTKKGSQKISKKACLSRINEVLNNYKPSPSLQGKEIYGTSYYYSVVVQAKMTTKRESVKVTLKDIYLKAKKFCKNPEKKEPFLCMDLLFVHTSLSRLYNLTGDSTIHMVSKINGFNATWPLGFAFQKYEQGVFEANSKVLPPK